MSLSHLQYHLFNLSLVSLGVAMSVVGIWIRADKVIIEASRLIDTYNMVAASSLLILDGCCLAIMAAVGVATLVLNNAGVLAVIATIIHAIVHGFGTKLQAFTTDQLLGHLQRAPYYDDSKRLLDFLQIKLGCCGAVSFNDYTRFGGYIPVSCHMSGGGSVTLNDDYISGVGCGQALRRFLELRSAIAALLCLAAALLQLLVVAIVLFIFHSKGKL